MFAIIAHQLGRHAFHFAAIEHVQEQRLQNVVTVMAQRDLSGTQLSGRTVQNAATQA